MKQLLIALFLFLTLGLPVSAQDDDLPTTDSLATIFADSIQNQDAVQFAQCWISASQFMELMQKVAAEHPEIADEIPDLETTLEYYRMRNRRVRRLFENLESVIQEHNLSVDGITVQFGEVQQIQEDEIIGYETSQIFTVESDSDWSIEFEIDDILSFGGLFMFFDSPLHAVLTLPNGETINLLAQDEE